MRECEERFLLYPLTLERRVHPPRCGPRLPPIVHKSRKHKRRDYRDHDNNHLETRVVTKSPLDQRRTLAHAMLCVRCPWATIDRDALGYGVLRECIPIDAVALRGIGWVRKATSTTRVLRTDTSILVQRPHASAYTLPIIVVARVITTQPDFTMRPTEIATAIAGRPVRMVLCTVEAFWDGTIHSIPPRETCTPLVLKCAESMVTASIVRARYCRILTPATGCARKAGNPRL